MLGLIKESNNVEDSNDLNCSYCLKLRELNEYFNFFGVAISWVSTAISLACCNHLRTDYSEPGVSPLFNKPGVSPFFNKPGVSPLFNKPCRHYSISLACRHYSISQACRHYS